MTTPTLSFRGATKIFRHGIVEVPALREVDLDLMAGSITAIMGPSGSGKSTLLHLAAGMVMPTAGQVVVAGSIDVGRCNPAQLARLRRTEVGVVFQQYNLLPTLTALENVTLPLELDGMSLRQARGVAEEALERVGIERPFDRFPDDLSGGQQQRVAIARAVAVPRRLVLADEPTGALDTQTGDRIMDLFTELAEAGAAVLVVTHEPRVAGFADRVVTLRDGRVVSDTANRPSRPPAATDPRDTWTPPARPADAVRPADTASLDEAWARPATPDADSDPTVAPRPATEGSNPSDPSDPTAVIR
ncbi:MAG: ABC transporter ATP-binding protein [Microthrixaceae bacterium]|nr:ABC transporter ATP-binding protein [Acidimicrobiales bacterium]MCB9404947.1 ABC transporter ATP-binding protein [Microthrixaceae bacterium]